jgi:hypothetical protein
MINGAPLGAIRLEATCGSTIAAVTDPPIAIAGGIIGGVPSGPLKWSGMPPIQAMPLRHWKV